MAFGLAIIGLYLLSWIELRSPGAPSGTNVAAFGAIASTLFVLSAGMTVHRFHRDRSGASAVSVAFLLGPGAVWTWTVFVSPGPPAQVLVTVVSAAALSLGLLVQALWVARWLELFTGLGVLGVLLVASRVVAHPEAARSSTTLALLAVAAGTASLYGALVDLELIEHRNLDDLLRAKQHVEKEMERAEDVLHDLRNGLLALEAAVATFDGELAAPVRAEAARLRRLTVQGRRTIGQFDLRSRVAELVESRRASGVDIDLVSDSPIEGAWGEESEVLAIVDNLLSNAQRHGDHSPISVTIASARERVSVAVTNGGPGIVDPDPDRLFRRGVTANGDGQGIGLARAHLLAGLNQAELSYCSEPGLTTFVLDLRAGPPPFSTSA